MKNKIKISDIFAYIVGNYRFALYNSDFKFLIRKHIREQYEWRLTLMNPECYNSGSCIKCGCDTPNLQMASKACKGMCYEEFADKKHWEAFKKIWKGKLPTRDTKQIAELLKNSTEVHLYKKYPLTPREAFSSEYVLGFDAYKEDEKDSVRVNGYPFNIVVDSNNKTINK